MALFADDVQRLKLIASRVRTAYAPIRGTVTTDDDADFLRGLADRILRELSEPVIFPWPGPEDEPPDPSDSGSYRERP